MLRFSLTILLCTFLAAAANAGDVRTVEYTWLTAGKPSGSQTVKYDSNDDVRISFQFNDRGRGPETESTVRIGQSGTIESFEVSGKNYRKGEVNEKFSTSGGKASWQSNIESGHAEFDGSAFYMPNNAAPEILAMLARAILKTDNQQIALLPTGTASIKALTEVELTEGDNTAHLTLYGITGIDTSPSYVWLDQDDLYFGVDHGWFGLTRQGWEKHLDTLKEAQTKATDDFFEELSRSNMRRIDDMLVIKGARIFDSIAGKLTDPATVFVWDGKIAAIYYAETAIPEGTIVIEAQGKTLMPSLWDMHGHVSVESFPNYLAAGVTNVRDMANDPATIEKLSDDLDAERIIGPDLFYLGFIDKRGEYSAPTGMLADSVEDAIAFVDYYAQRGHHGIKLYSSIEPDWVKPIADYAHERNMVVMGHVPAYMTAHQAIDAGYNEITHVNMILLNFLGAEELDTRTPVRFLVPGKQAGDLNLRSAKVKKFIKLMKAKNIAHDPTLSIFIDMFRNVPGEISPTYSYVADNLPSTTRRDLIAATGFNDGHEKAFARAAERSMQLVKMLHDNGIRILPGTDAGLPGFTLIRELIYYTEAGIPANEALQLGTISAAEHLGVDQRLGSISVGKDAYMHIVDGNPIEDMSALYRVEEVIKGRQMYSAPDLLRAQGFTPFSD